MKPFIFSADGHVREPRDLFTDGLPASLREYGVFSKREGDVISTFAGEKLIIRTRVNPTGQKGGLGRDIRGAEDLDARWADLQLDGIDAEIIFPTLGMFTFLLENREAELACAEVYNNWINGYLAGHYDRFVRCGTLPVRHPADAVAEMERLAKLGFTAALLPSSIPSGVPNYNHEHWDPIFDAAQRLQIVLTLHTATGRADVRPERGPGGAIINYTDQMRDAMHSVMYMVAGGILDRFPRVKIAVIESGASWLAALAERMDEVAEAHESFVRPKLSGKPSEIIARQVAASFQYDRAAIMSRSVTGTQSIMWGSDYPHTEGTFPDSKDVIAHMFDGIDITEQEKADILGLNAARLFRLPVPKQNAV